MDFSDDAVQSVRREPAQVECELQSALENAWQEVIAACKAYEARLKEYPAANCSDPFQPLQEAADRRNVALEEYQDALVALTDFTFKGKWPPRGNSKSATQY
jgi:hypothetical protein